MRSLFSPDLFGASGDAALLHLSDAQLTLLLRLLHEIDPATVGPVGSRDRRLFLDLRDDFDEAVERLKHPELFTGVTQ